MNAYVMSQNYIDLFQYLLRHVFRLIELYFPLNIYIHTTHVLSLIGKQTYQIFLRDAEILPKWHTKL
jgi:hypothetical protein